MSLEKVKGGNGIKSKRVYWRSARLTWELSQNWTEFCRWRWCGLCTLSSGENFWCPLEAFQQSWTRRRLARGSRAGRELRHRRCVGLVEGFPAHGSRIRPRWSLRFTEWPKAHRALRAHIPLSRFLLLLPSRRLIFKITALAFCQNFQSKAPFVFKMQNFLSVRSLHFTAWPEHIGILFILQAWSEQIKKKIAGRNTVKTNWGFLYFDFAPQRCIVTCYEIRGFKNFRVNDLSFR